MNLAEALLAADAGKVMKKATKDFEVKRLSGIIGEPFYFICARFRPDA